MADKIVMPPTFPPKVMNEAIELLLDWHENDGNQDVISKISHWRAEDPMHNRAWEQIEAVNATLDPLTEGTPRQLAHIVLQPKTLSRRQLVKGSFGLLLLLGLGSSVRHLPLSENRLIELHTRSGERRRVVLHNGTIISLGGQTTLRYRLKGNVYQLQVLAGEILVTTSHDKTSPAYRNTSLQVLTREVAVTPMGTRFSVRREQQQSRVAVYQGKVMALSSRQATENIITAGQGAVFDSQGHLTASPSVRGEDAWERGLIIAYDLPLSELLATMNRHHEQKITWAPSLATLRVSGTYPLDQSDEVISALEAILPLRAKRASPIEVVLQPERRD